jgi:hypothetical protein
VDSVQGNVTGRKVVPGAESIDPDELIDAVEAAKLLRQRPQTLAAWRSEKRGPEYVKIGRSIFYRRASIGEFIAASIVKPGAV